MRLRHISPRGAARAAPAPGGQPSAPKKTVTRNNRQLERLDQRRFAASGKERRVRAAKRNMYFGEPVIA